MSTVNWFVNNSCYTLSHPSSAVQRILLLVTHCQQLTALSTALARSSMWSCCTDPALVPANSQRCNKHSLSGWLSTMQFSFWCWIFTLGERCQKNDKNETCYIKGGPDGWGQREKITFCFFFFQLHRNFWAIKKQRRFISEGGWRVCRNFNMF